MKKKIMSFLLCVVMLAGCLMSTGCSVASDNATSTDTTAEGVADSTRTSVTLSLWVPCEEGTTEEALYQVEQAINEVTQAQFDTAIKLYAIPTAEYDEVVKARIAFLEERVIKEIEEEANKRQEQIAAQNKGETLVDETTEYVNPNMDGEYSLVVPGATEYVPLDKNQLDIFLIRGMEDYTYYVENGYALELNDELNNNSKVLNNYIYPDFFTAITMNEKVYAVPNNKPIGEATYFLVNKDILEAESLDPANYDTINRCISESADGYSLVDDIVANYTDYVPVYGDFTPAYWDYWNADANVDEFSVLASRVQKGDKVENLTFTNILAESNFTNFYSRYKHLKEEGLIDTSETVPEKFGVGYITCTGSEIAKYEEDYHIYVYEGARGTVEEYAESMFAVSSRTENLSRSMEIITYLNTDPTLRTILQYGVQDRHWKYDETNKDVIVKLDISKESADITYNMNLFETGNVYMTYPAYGEPMSNWESSKDQNSNSYLPSNYYFITTQAEVLDAEGNGTGVFRPVFVNDYNEAWFEDIAELSADIFARMEAMTADEFDSQVANLADEVARDLSFKKLTWQPSESDLASGAKEDEGYYAEGSLWYQWQQYCISIYGEEFKNWEL